MKMLDFIDINGMNYSNAARQLNVTPQAVRSWCIGERTPTPELMSKIYNWSHGQVTPNDFYDLPAAVHATPAAVSPTSGADDDARGICSGQGFDLSLVRAAG